MNGDTAFAIMVITSWVFCIVYITILLYRKYQKNKAMEDINNPKLGN